jgi:hypothetical protein
VARSPSTAGQLLTTPVTLADGDEIRFGSVSITFRRYADEPTKTELEAE